MHLGLTALVVSDQLDFFAFFKPFQLGLWLTLALVTFLIGVLLWFFSTFSSFGFYGRCVQIAHLKVRQEHQNRRHILRLANSLCSSLVYCVGQRADRLHPVPAYGRVSVAVWWFAKVLIIISTYTANLAAFLTIKRFFSSKQHFEAFKIWQGRPRFPTVLSPTATANSHSRSLKRLPSPALSPCGGKWSTGTLTTIGSFFGKMGYGTGIPKDSPYTKQLSQAIVELGHEGHIDCLE